MATKKEKKEEEELEEEGEYEGWLRFFGSSQDVRRSVGALFFFAFAVFFSLSFVSQAGFVGEYIAKISGYALGWGKWIFPVLLLLVAWFLLQRSSRLYYVSIVAISVSFVALLSILHIFVDPQEMAQVASEGRSGGYLGYGIAFGMTKMFGLIASAIFLSVLFIAGLFIAFGVSLIPLFEGFGWFKQKKEKKEESSDEDENEENQEDDEEKEEMDEDDEEKDLFEEQSPSLEGESQGLVKNVRFEHDMPEEEKPQNKDIFEEEDEEYDENDEDDEEDDEEDEDIPEKPKKRKKRKHRKMFWKLPSLKLLEQSNQEPDSGDADHKKKVIVETLAQFGIEVVPVAQRVGPTVTQFRFRPARGVRLEKIVALTSNLTYELAAHSIRVEAPIPGESLIGIEVPNRSIATVCLRDALDTPGFRRAVRETSLPIALGKDVAGEFFYTSLSKMPHLLVAGATGSGKSVCIHSIILSFLYTYAPDQLKLILIDPKRIELMLYKDIPHLKTPVIVEMKKVVGVLHWAIGEMEKRYEFLGEVGARDLASYNKKIHSGDYESDEDLEVLPFIVIVIDEFSDLMMSHGKDIENMVVRLAQKSRAVGIHLIISTQRPSVETLTGLIKSNIPTRIALKVATQIDSRTILDRKGAEKLLGLGDMLYVTSDSTRLKRVQGVLVTEEEVRDVVRYLVVQKKENEDEEDEDEGGGDEAFEDEEGMKSPETGDDDIDFDAFVQAQDQDEYYDRAKELVMRSGEASASMLQRHFSVGYNRAAKLLDALEAEGVVGPKKGAKPREVLVGPRAFQGASEDEEDISE